MVSDPGDDECKRELEIYSSERKIRMSKIMQQFKTKLENLLKDACNAFEKKGLLFQT